MFNREAWDETRCFLAPDLIKKINFDLSFASMDNLSEALHNLIWTLEQEKQSILNNKYALAFNTTQNAFSATIDIVKSTTSMALDRLISLSNGICSLSELDSRHNSSETNFETLDDPLQMTADLESHKSAIEGNLFPAIGLGVAVVIDRKDLLTTHVSNALLRATKKLLVSQRKDSMLLYLASMADYARRAVDIWRKTLYTFSVEHHELAPLSHSVSPKTLQNLKKVLINLHLTQHDKTHLAAALLDKSHIEITTKRSKDCDRGEGRGDGGSCRCKIRTLSVYIPIPGSTSGCLAAHRVSQDVLMDSQINSPFIFMSDLKEAIVMTPERVQSEGGEHLRKDYAVLRHKPIRLPRGEVALLLPKDHIFFPLLDTNRKFNIECLNTSHNTSFIQHVGILTVTRGILAISRYIFILQNLELHNLFPRNCDYRGAEGYMGTIALCRTQEKKHY